MNRFILCVCVLSATLCRTAPGSAAESQRDLVAATRAIFSAKCTGCHGANLEKPKGRFGYVLDLARVANNREMVVPGSPDESELWELVRRGEMPPAESPAGPLNETQKEVIHRWISAGAPSTAPTETSVLPSSEPSAGPPDRPALSIMKRRFGPLGALHLLVIHFPIALLIAAAAREFWSLLERDRVPNPVVRFCVFLGAAGAVVAAALGWLHAWNGHGAGTPEVLALHRWSGTASAAWAVSTLWLSEQESRRGARSRGFRAWLFIGTGLVAAASHLGGVLVHGEHFLAGG